MAFTDSLSISYTGNGQAVTSVVKSLTADAQAGYDGSIPDSTTNQEVDVAIKHSTLAGFVATSDHAITIKTNSTSAPDDTLSVAANTPIIFYTGGPWANPLTADVTKMYITNNSGGTAVVKIRALYDSTP